MITLICGPMFSGKSTELTRQLERHKIANKKTIFFRPSKDTRDYISHNSDKKYDFLSISDFTQLDLPIIYEKVNSIFVDEFFMIKNNKRLCETLPNNIDLFFSGLLADSDAKLWPEAQSILPYCDNIIKLNAICIKCGNELGNYSSYIGDSKTKRIEIGDNNYQALCRQCYLNNILQRRK